MEDENGLELSLGLSLGGSSAKTKAKGVIPDINVEGSSNQGNRGTSNAHLMHFFHASTVNQETVQKHADDTTTQPHLNFWRERGKTSAAVDSSTDPLKRRLLSQDINQRRKHQRADHDEGTGGTTKNSPISISTDDGSTGENEDIAESEAEGSNSWIVSQREDSVKGSDTKHGSVEAGFSLLQRQLSFSGSDGQLKAGSSLAPQAVGPAVLPYKVPTKVAGTSSMSNVASISSSGAIQLRLLKEGMSPAVPDADGGSGPTAFGYATVQLPTLETSTSWVFGSQTTNGPSSAVKKHSGGSGDLLAEEAVKKFSAPHLQARTLVYDRNTESVKAKCIGEAASSSATPAADEWREESTIRQREAANQSAAESSLLGSAIKPGLASNVKFGGCGSYPDLPWVSTTGPGPDGKTISGVTYKYGKNQLKIVCSCHGSHMSPEEFVQHARADITNTEDTAAPPAADPALPAAEEQCP